MTTVTVTYGNICERCKMFSAFEGKSLVDENGESKHSDIRLTDLEKDLMKSYIDEGLELVNAEVGNAVEIDIEESAEDDEGNSSAIGKSIEETLAAYVMHRWMAGKVENRSSAYGSVFKDMLSATKRLAWRRKKPTMTEDA